MVHKTAEAGRSNVILQGIERRVLTWRSRALGRQLSSIATEATLEHPYFRAQVESKGFQATLRPVMYDTDAFIEGEVRLDYDWPRKPIINARAHTYSERFNGNDFAFSTQNPSGIVTIEHLMVITELRNRIRSAAADPSQIIITRE